jgi:hypothetical protein
MEADLLKEIGKESLIRKIRGGLKADALIIIKKEKEEVKSLIDKILSFSAAYNISIFIFIRLKGE